MKKYRITVSIFTRIIAVFLLIVIPVYVLGIIIFQKSREMMIEQYNEGINKQVSIYFDNLESDFFHIREMQENLLIDEDLNKLKYNPVKEMDYDMVKSINRVMKQLDNIQLSSKNINHISVSIPKLERKIYSFNATPTYQFISAHELQDDLDSASGLVDIKKKDDGYYIITTPSYWKGDINNLSFVIQSRLSEQQIINTINQCNVVDGAMSFISFNEFGTTLSQDYGQEVLDFVASVISEDVKLSKNQSINIAGGSYLVSRYYSGYLDAWYTQLIPEETALHNINKFKIWYEIFSVLVAITSILYTLFTYVMVKKPIDILVNSFKKVERGDFDVNIEHKQNDEFAVAYTSFNKMVGNLKRLIDEVYVGKILNQKSELRQLQAQINPHFLYNSFFILKNRIIKKQYDNAVGFCDMLGLYFNYMTKNFKDYSTLQDEVNHARIYADIQAIRFVNRIEVVFDELPQQYKNIVVPKLIMQPLIENSFKYGLEDMEFDGLLGVSFEADNGYLHIIVEDNGLTIAQDDDHITKLQNLFTDAQLIKEPTGLLNIHRRIQLFSSEECGINFYKSELGGLKVVIKIKIDNENQNKDEVD